MKFGDVEKAVLNSARGDAPRKAMELIVRCAGALGAEQRCRITWADLFCGLHRCLDVIGSEHFDRIF
jgi:predicted aconitase